MMKAVVLLFCLAVAVANAGNLTVSNTLGSNMVLQRAPDISVIFGWAAIGDIITVGFNTKNYTATTSAEGAWKVKLPATKAGGPYTITVTSSEGDKVVFTNVLFGDVWLCGGQSNMQFTVDQAFNATEAVEAADDYPNIRVFTVGELYYSPSPLLQLHAIAQPWSVASSSSIGTGNWSEFSAVCWFTGKNLYDKLKVPIGLISSNWGGTVIQAWSSAVALKKCNVTTSSTGNEANSVLYNAMIVPYLPQSILGVLWYQGEQNVGQAPLYSCMFPAMISDWRANFANVDFTFLFVQLAPWITTSDVQDLRQAQLSAMKLSNVGYASAVDLGDPLSPYGSIHPRNKQAVGERLANAAQAIAYGNTTALWKGPTFMATSYKIANAILSFSVTFTLSGSKGLVNQPASCPPQQPASSCANWAVILSNGTTIPLQTVSVTGALVTLQATGVATSLSVKSLIYAYAPWPVTTIFSKEGLPAIPFQYNY